MLVVEIKSDGDDASRNKAKPGDGREHFIQLNDRLKADGSPWRHHFYFLSPSDYGTFFAAVADERLNYVSSLMTQLSHP